MNRVGNTSMFWNCCTLHVFHSPWVSQWVSPWVSPEVTWRRSDPWPCRGTRGPRSTGCPSCRMALEPKLWPAHDCPLRVSIKAASTRNSWRKPWRKPWRILGEYLENTWRFCWNFKHMIRLFGNGLEWLEMDCEIVGSNMEKNWWFEKIAPEEFSIAVVEATGMLEHQIPCGKAHWFFSV